MKFKIFLASLILGVFAHQGTIFCIDDDAFTNKSIDISDDAEVDTSAESTSSSSSSAGSSDLLFSPEENCYLLQEYNEITCFFESIKEEIIQNAFIESDDYEVHTEAFLTEKFNKHQFITNNEEIHLAFNQKSENLDLNDIVKCRKINLHFDVISDFMLCKKFEIKEFLIIVLEKLKNEIDELRKYLTINENTPNIYLILKSEIFVISSSIYRILSDLKMRNEDHEAAIELRLDLMGFPYKNYESLLKKADVFDLIQRIFVYYLNGNRTDLERLNKFINYQQKFFSFVKGSICDDLKHTVLNALNFLAIQEKPDHLIDIIGLLPEEFFRDYKDDVYKELIKAITVNGLTERSFIGLLNNLEKKGVFKDILTDDSNIIKKNPDLAFVFANIYNVIMDFAKVSDLYEVAYDLSKKFDYLYHAISVNIKINNPSRDMMLQLKLFDLNINRKDKNNDVKYFNGLLGNLERNMDFSISIIFKDITNKIGLDNILSNVNISLELINSIKNVDVCCDKWNRKKILKQYLDDLNNNFLEIKNLIDSITNFNTKPSSSSSSCSSYLSSSSYESSVVLKAVSSNISSSSSSSSVRNLVPKATKKKKTKDRNVVSSNSSSSSSSSSVRNVVSKAPKKKKTKDRNTVLSSSSSSSSISTPSLILKAQKVFETSPDQTINTSSSSSNASFEMSMPLVKSSDIVQSARSYLKTLAPKKEKKKTKKDNSLKEAAFLESKKIESSSSQELKKIDSKKLDHAGSSLRSAYNHASVFMPGFMSTMLRGGKKAKTFLSRVKSLAKLKWRPEQIESMVTRMGLTFNVQRGHGSHVMIFGEDMKPITMPNHGDCKTGALVPLFETLHQRSLVPDEIGKKIKNVLKKELGDHGEDEDDQIETPFQVSVDSLSFSSFPGDTSESDDLGDDTENFEDDSSGEE
ncbi:MAG: hypothetical protein Q8L85_06895 [Alphaproteobacteria bacterium]|nr:hypothetical protein [Alphaproteobacteria bacterium]